MIARVRGLRYFPLFSETDARGNVLSGDALSKATGNGRCDRAILRSRLTLPTIAQRDREGHSCSLYVQALENKP